MNFEFMAKIEMYPSSRKLTEKISGEEIHSGMLFTSHGEEIRQYYFIDNICNLRDRSPESVTRFIKYRFSKNQIYTWAGQTLLAVQPYHTKTKREEEKENEPNVSAVVSRALFKLTNKLGKINQMIVISGDSGSGKTYSGCLALKYIAFKYSNNRDDGLSDILKKTCSAATVLAAFGNASTIHNCNSSRFGKLTKMQCRDEKFVGSYIQTYLLEKSRVSGPNKGESNFHIFSQVLNDLEECLLEKIYLSKTTEYLICPKITYNRKNSLSDIAEMMNFLKIGHFNEILKIISLILNLGNIVFTSKEGNLVILQECKQYLNFCAWILNCSTSSLAQLLTRRLIAPKLRRGSLCFTSCANIEECEERRNSLMRFLYERLFIWLVERINDQTYSRKKHTCLGILDIYGFEIFPHNTFEQLCINYANERLHQFYMSDYYNKQVNFLYEKSEKVVRYDMSKYNKRINLLDGSLSIFGILNEECLVKRYNTDMFIATRLSNCLRKNEFFIDRKDFRSTRFSIKHYAGVVEYDSKSMVSKNRDKLPEEMLLFLKENKLTFFSEILNLRDEELQVSHSKTLLSKFKKSLDNLMLSLDQADIHYIKCLKPNREQLPNCFDDGYFMEELKYNGIIDTLNLDVQNFSTVLSKTEFAKRFDLEILKELEGLLEDKVYVGKEKIYFSDDSFSSIIKYKMISMNASVRKIQRLWRSRMKRRHEAASLIQRFFRQKLFNDKTVVNETLDWSLEEITITENINYKDTEVFLQENDKKMKTVKNSRFIFRQERIISRMKIAQIPVRFHTRKTCLPYSHILPMDETPKGLVDIF